MHMFSMAHNLQKALGKRPRMSGRVLGGSLDIFWGAWGCLGEVLGTAEIPCGKSRYLLRKIRQTDGFIGWTSVMDRSKARDRHYPDHLCWGSGDFILQNADLIKMATLVTAG